MRKPKQTETIIDTKAFNQMLMNKVIPSVKASGDNVVRTTALELIRRIMKTWPVDLGRSRAAWYPIFDALGVPQPISKGSDLAAQAEGKEKGVYRETSNSKGLLAEMHNGVDYSVNLEFGPHSQQAPTGTVRNSLMSLRGDMQKRKRHETFLDGLKGVRKAL